MRKRNGIEGISEVHALLSSGWADVGKHYFFEDQIVFDGVMLLFLDDFVLVLILVWLRIFRKKSTTGEYRGA
ncbi:hypothetical protein KIH39_18395 [Telmatocola sphagniphila]|uniref:Uncharacterized protein n=1 Tax=Telmatocola sphagniphila TaxID=1123043 RepID=A0A8E6B2P0_9BACT|nr:hypothetical protein [Telmatocola sphagniphila]QVL30808.1 hypothetical protein KIH39_18395 [Telmatocola sphagniphila]